MARLCVLLAALHLPLVEGAMKYISHNITLVDSEDYARHATECQNIFVDIGANIGIHARFLFEPHRYPGTSYTKVFDAVFGAERNLSRTCALEIEPNPAHSHRHQKLQTAYQRKGWRYYYIPAAASISEKTFLTFYKNSRLVKGSINEDWTFGMKDSETDESFREPVRVSTIDLSFFFKQLHNHTSTSNPHVIVKMDIEGAEFMVLPQLITHGILCQFVDFMTVEFHNWMAPLPSVASWQKDYFKTAKGAQIFAATLSSMISDAGHTGCKLKSLKELDDESYLHDGQPFP